MGYHFADADVPPVHSGLYEVIVDAWWVVDSENGGLAFWSLGPGRAVAPQCNSDKSIVERFARRVTDGTERPTELRQIPVAYIPRSPSDY